MKVSVRLDRSVKNAFFDREKVILRVERKRLRAMAKMGAEVRTIARRSLRPGRFSSEPGKPPNSHTRLLRDQIWFAYDSSADSVVIGPVGFKRSNAPEVLEFGGVTRVRDFPIRQRRLIGETPKGRKKYAFDEAGRYTGPLTIQARPFMGPALTKSRTALPRIWEEAITK